MTDGDDLFKFSDNDQEGTELDLQELLNKAPPRVNTLSEDNNMSEEEEEEEEEEYTSSINSFVWESSLEKMREKLSSITILGAPQLRLMIYSSMDSQITHALSQYEHRNSERADVLEIKRKLEEIKEELDESDLMDISNSSSFTEYDDLQYVASRLETSKLVERVISFDKLNMGPHTSNNLIILVLEPTSKKIHGCLMASIVNPSGRGSYILQINSVSVDYSSTNRSIEKSLILSLVNFGIENFILLNLTHIIMNKDANYPFMESIGFVEEVTGEDTGFQRNLRSGYNLTLKKRHLYHILLEQNAKIVNENKKLFS
jgi:hypothetical protein